MDQTVLRSFSTKLGISSHRIIRKAQEFHRLIEVKTTTTSLAALRITGCCEVVMCLDLAARHCAETVDKNSLVKLSGLNKRTYMNSLKALETLLGLGTEHTIDELAVQCGCTGATQLARKLLHKYEGVQREKSCDLDFGVPLFQAAALSAACRKLKIKVEWAKLRDVASVKRSTYDRLVTDLETMAQSIIGEKKSPDKKRGTSFYEELERAVEEEEASAAKRSKVVETEDAKVNFELWKQKILAQAAKQQTS